jgi:hypothetical protein
VYVYNTHYGSQASVLLGLLDPENETLMILENTGNYLPSNTAVRTSVGSVYYTQDNTEEINILYRILKQNGVLSHIVHEFYLN